MEGKREIPEPYTKANEPPRSTAAQTMTLRCDHRFSGQWDDLNTGAIINT